MTCLSRAQIRPKVSIRDSRRSSTEIESDRLRFCWTSRQSNDDKSKRQAERYHEVTQCWELGDSKTYGAHLHIGIVPMV